MANTTVTTAPAAASSHGASTTTAMSAASCSSVPQLGAFGEKPSPAKDSVVSARIAAGISWSACVRRKPVVAGARCR
jgi:hypothetical protein